MQTRKGFSEGVAMTAAVAAAAITYGILAAHPWPASPLNAFLATFGRANAAVWLMQIVWYLAAVAMTGFSLWPTRRSSQLICALAAAYFAWIGIAYFAWLMPGITAGLIIWRDRTSCPAWQTVTAGLLLALMIAWSGLEDVLTGLALILVAVTLTQAIRAHPRPSHAAPIPPPG